MKKMEKTGREKTSKIQAAMREKGVDFLILTQPGSYESLIFTRIPFICILRRIGNPVVFTHFDSTDIVGEQSWISDINGVYPYDTGMDRENKRGRDYLKETVGYMRSFNGLDGKIAMDLGKTPVNIYNFFKEESGMGEIIDFSVELNSIFSINTPEEIECIKKAATIAEKGVLCSQKFLQGSKGDVTENQLAAYAEYHMRKCSVDSFFVRSSVASGRRTVMIGATDSDRKIGPEDIVDVDYSPVYRGYFADICRPISKRPFTGKVLERCRIIEEALDIAIDSIRPGVEAASVDKAVRKHFKTHGFDGKFIHHTGHPVGNSWGIMITSNSGGIIRKGMAFALEPGIYDHNIGGLRIEDNVFVTEDGAVNMMSLPRILQEK